MKHTKRIFSILLAVMMLLTLGVTAFAAEGDGTLTITILNDCHDHKYVAYQVFSGDITGGKLVNIQWGNGVNGEDLLSALKKNSAFGEGENNKFYNCTTAEEVANVLAGFKTPGDVDTTLVDAFATAVSSGNVLNSSNGKKSVNSNEPNANGMFEAKITGLSDGYYFIEEDPSENLENEPGHAATKYILELTNNNLEINAKADAPTLDKKIVEGGNRVNGTSAQVGEQVTFELTSKVPNMDGYTSYKYVINDTLSTGLTFNNDVKVSVKISDETDPIELSADKYYNVKKGTDVPSGHTFEIEFKDVINNLKTYKGKALTVTYTATVNDGAFTTDKETNTANITYSNNPNSDSEGKTTDKKVYVYDFDIIIDKYTGNFEGGKRLGGAEFILMDTTSETAETKYYKLDKNTDGKDVVTWVDSQNDATTVITNAAGAESFKGLKAGTYYLKETKAPDGYNLLKDPVKVEIKAAYNEDGTIKTGKDSGTTVTLSSTNNAYEQTQPIENKAGSTLPETGGIGTTILYVVGGLLVVGAVVLLVTKKRMNASEK